MGECSGEWGWVLELPPILTVNQTSRDTITGMHVLTMILLQELCNSYVLLATILNISLFSPELLKEVIFKLMLKFN